MKPEPARPAVSSRMARRFVESAAEEAGAENLETILAEAGLTVADIQDDPAARLDGARAAELSAALQRGLRRFFGGGARGPLIRIGRGMWERLVQHASLREKAELEIARRLPVPARRRRLLNLVAAYLREGGEAASVRSQDLDLILVHQGTAGRQPSDEPLCAVTLGLIQGALFWGTRQEADVEETACRAAGAPACEFRVSPGGK